MWARTLNIATNKPWPGDARARVQYIWCSIIRHPVVCSFHDAEELQSLQWCSGPETRDETLKSATFQKLNEMDATGFRIDRKTETIIISFLACYVAFIGAG